MSAANRFYYRWVRPVLPRGLRPWLRRLNRRQAHSLLQWPIEDRFVRFQYAILDGVAKRTQQEKLPIIGLWPGPHTFALVLTHDVETPKGVEFVLEVAAVEERLGFRSSFNFSPHAYDVPEQLLQSLRARGFEVGLHGLNHDGRLYQSQSEFSDRARSINGYLKQWNACGFRSPLMHRHPEWMQRLNIEYDLSFFDTDPYEPMPGGVVTVWPYVIGRFVELPTTLPQDHTLKEMFGAEMMATWLEKCAFISAHHGAAVMNTHPDYLRDPDTLSAYQTFLSNVAETGGCWAALPRDVARWWLDRSRTKVNRQGDGWILEGLEGGVVWSYVAASKAFVIPGNQGNDGAS